MLAQVKKIIIDTIYVDESFITTDSILKEDLGIDSLTKLELVLECENTFDIRIEDNELANLKTVGDVVAMITRKINN